MSQTQNLSFPARFIQRATNALRSKGVLGTAKAVVRRLLPKRYYDLVLKFEVGQEALPSIMPHIDGLSVRRLLPDDPAVESLVEFDEWKWAKSAEDIRSAMRRGDRCYAGVIDGKVVSYMWATGSGQFYDQDLKRNFRLGTHEVYLQKGFTIPEYRGQGIIRLIGIELYNDLAINSDYRYGVMMVNPHNHSSLSGARQMGFVDIGRAGYISWLGLRLRFVTAPRTVLQGTGRLSLRA